MRDETTDGGVTRWIGIEQGGRDGREGEGWAVEMSGR